MSQGALSVADGGGAAVRAAINAALARLASRASGTARPSDIGTYELWIETDNPGAGIVSIWQYDGSSDVLWALLDTSSHAIAWYSGGALVATQAYVTGVAAGGGSFKNRLINGDFAIDQRNEGAAQTFTAAAAVAYTVDRWYASCTGANITGQRVAGTSPARYAYRFTGATSNTAVLFGQRIEVANIYDLISADVVVSGKVKSSSLTSLTWTAYYANAADDFSAKTQIATGTISSITSALAAFSFTFNAGASAGNGICIEFTGGALIAAQTLHFETVQLEPGTTATAFERRSAQERLTACQRYYRKSYAPGTAPGAATALGVVGGALNDGSTTGQIGVAFATPMRGVPTLAYWDTAGTASKVSTLAGGGTSYTDGVSGNPAPFGASPTGFVLGGSSSGHTAAFAHYSASAEI